MRPLLLLVSFLFLVLPVDAREPGLDWLGSKPELLTYRSTSPQGDGLYQISLLRQDSLVLVYLNIITPGFTKSIRATMTPAMLPQESHSLIVIDGQMMMETDCQYSPTSAHIRTLMRPYGTVLQADTVVRGEVVDFSQIPLLGRMLMLTAGKTRTFLHINPVTNRLMPVTVTGMGPENVGEIPCLRMECSDFEGVAKYWVETASPHRVIRIEQPKTQRVTELLR